MSEEKAYELRQPPWPEAVRAKLPEGRFKPHEEWAWARIANGLFADMSRYPGDDADKTAPDWLAGRASDPPNPKDAASFKPHHVLSELFLRTILFHEPWASAPESPRIRIRHALVEEPIDWSARETAGALSLHRCRFAAAIIWQGLQVRGLLSLQGSVLTEGLSADGMQVEGDLFCSEGFEATADVRLLGARIAGNAEFIGAKLSGALRADGMHVTGDLFCSEGFESTQDIRLLGMIIGGDASFMGAKLSGALIADRLHVEGGLFCSEGFETTGDIFLLGVRVGGAATFINAELSGALFADRLQVEGTLFLRQMRRLGIASLVGAEIGGSVQLGGLLEGAINLTGAEIKGALELNQGDWDLPGWGEDAALILRNASADALAGWLTAFRRDRTHKRARRRDFVRLDLAGFRYQRIGGLQAKPADTLAAASVGDLKCWLEAGAGEDADGSERAFNPDPYRQLAHALEAAGDRAKAQAIRRALAGHEHRAARGWRWWGFAFSWLFIGYGYSNARAIGWFALLVLIGASVGLWLAGDRVFLPTWAGVAEAFRWLGFSLANATPLIVFDKAHETFLAAQLGVRDPSNVPVGVAWAFYAQRVLGFVVLSFLAAGVTGVARRRVE